MHTHSITFDSTMDVSSYADKSIHRYLCQGAYIRHVQYMYLSDSCQDTASNQAIRYPQTRYIHIPYERRLFKLVVPLCIYSYFCLFILSAFQGVGVLDTLLPAVALHVF